MSDEKTYEMLWDCKYCGATKLLGLTHRHCPSCGAPQDQEARYFPSDADKVAVEDHEFVGADRLCPACNEANSAKSNNCRHCGSPLDGSKAVTTRADQIHAEGGFGGDNAQAAKNEIVHGRVPAPAPEPPKKKSIVGWLIGAGCLTMIVVGALILVVFLLWTRETALEVASHRWERVIDVETYGEVTEKDWCDQMPTGAREQSRSQAKRDTKKVPDGEECKTRKKDQGDGTFKEVKECQPKYKEVAVMADQCTYRIRKWKVSRTATANGSLKDERRWPDPALKRTGTCDGCERAGDKREKYVVVLKDTDSGKTHDCELPEAKWAKMATGKRYQGKIRKLSGGLDCSSLTPAK